VGLFDAYEFDIIPTSWDDENSPQTGKEGLPEFIPENVVYKLCFKASNEVAWAFQNLVADEILPSIRKTGGYISDSQSFVADLDEATRKMFNVCLLMVGATNQKIDALEA